MKQTSIVDEGMQGMDQSMRHEEQKKSEKGLTDVAQAIFKAFRALPAHVVLLDEAGKIIAVNDAWERSQEDHVLLSKGAGVGLNYLDICATATGASAGEATRATAGIRAVLTGKQAEFSMEYVCPAPGEQRWFQMAVTPVEIEGMVQGAVVTHLNITEPTTKAMEKQQVAATPEVPVKEQSLYPNAEKLSAILESITDGFFTLNEDWEFTFVNREAERLLNRSREELLGKCFWEAFPDTRGTGLEHRFRYAMAENQAALFEEYCRQQQKWFEFRVFPSAEGSTVYFRDVTQNRRDEEQLRLLENCVSRLNDIVVITEAEPVRGVGPRILFVNDAFERHTGYTREKVLGQTPQILQGPKTQPEALERIRKALNNWQPVREELINYKKSGEEIWLELDIVPIADETGYYTHWVAIERDITERKRNEERVRESEERFQLVSKATNDTIWDLNLITREIWWNEGFRKMFGYQPEDIEPTLEGWMKFIHPEDRERVATEAERAIREGGNYWAAEYQYRRKSGEYVPVLERGYVIRDDSGRPIRMIGVITDLTERKNLEAQLLQSQKMEAVGRLAGGVAHDFNNLLTVILNNCELLMLTSAHNDPIRPVLADICSAGDRAANLTRQLLAFSRKQVLSPQVLDLNNAIYAVEKMLNRLIGEDIRLITVLQPHLAPIRVDPGQLEQVILNLAVNSRDAMPRGGRLIIETSNVEVGEAAAERKLDCNPGWYVALTVTDTGVGMPPEVQARIFEPFFTTKGPGKGTGLGLSTVFGIVKQSEGAIEVQSEVGLGTSVTIYFPAVGEKTGAATVSNPAVPGGSETVLLVEDEEGVRRVARLTLEMLGYQVLEANNGREAMKMVNNHSGTIHLALTDIIMPEVGGYELAKILRLERPQTRVLFMSGYSDEAVVREGEMTAADAFLQKPFTPSGLARAVRDILESSPATDCEN
ncbi:MAG: hypothetical protein OHK0029_13850 [Armatimonadaceae bacterium]